MNGKVVLITGSSSGIGLACAQVFGRAGARVVISARNPERLKEAELDLAREGIDVLSVVGDVAVEADCQRMVEATVQKFGRLDILINNAGISMRALFEQAELSVIRQVMEINFFGTVAMTKFALPHVIEAKGSIVGISSIAGYRGLPGRTGYSASKFAMNGFLESIRTELLYRGVHVLTASPGFTGTNIRKTALNEKGEGQGESPLEEGKIMSAEEVAAHILRAVQRRKREIVLTRQGKLTVWMNKRFGGLMDKMVYNHFAAEKDSPLPAKK